MTLAPVRIAESLIAAIIRDYSRANRLARDIKLKSVTTGFALWMD